MSCDQGDVEVGRNVSEQIILEKKRAEERLMLNQSLTRVTVFDYDDTIFPSSWFSQLLAHAPSLTREMARELARVDQRASLLIREALTYSSVVIVTNAEEGWVEESARLYLPHVYRCLDAITVVSARSRYESLYPLECGKWKAMTFDDELSQLRSQNCEYLSVLSIGDSLHDREAAFAFGRSNDRVIVKSIKMIECPSPYQLATEQELIASALGSMVLSRDSLDLKLSIQSSL